MTYYLGVDVGGTTSTLAVGNDRREIVYVSEQFRTTPEKGPQSSIAAIVAAAIESTVRLGISLNDVATVGLATPGPATIDGVLLSTPNLNRELWDNFPIRAGLEDALRQHHKGLAVRYIGDGQSSVPLGEYSIRSLRFCGTVSHKICCPTKSSTRSSSSSWNRLRGGAVLSGPAIQGSQGLRGTRWPYFSPTLRIPPRARPPAPRRQCLCNSRVRRVAQWPGPPVGIPPHAA